MYLKNYNNNKHEQHPFHIVDPSPWPIILALAIFNNCLVFVMYFNFFKFSFFQISWNLIFVGYVLTSWFYDIILEASTEGRHTLRVQKGIKLGMSLFIASEVMFFFGFFWAFFHYSLCPSIFIGGLWPPVGIDPVDPWGLPLSNTVILLSSGVTVNYTQKAIRYGCRWKTFYSLLATILYGLIFMYVQYFEYNSSGFSFNDSVYGSIFYITTGFHGFHVAVGTLFLIICLLRHYKYQLLRDHHVGLECAIWYWHFVDVVWIFLYLTVYDVFNIMYVKFDSLLSSFLSIF